LILAVNGAGVTMPVEQAEDAPQLAATTPDVVPQPAPAPVRPVPPIYPRKQDRN
jgi:hypothetical protein